MILAPYIAPVGWKLFSDKQFTDKVSNSHGWNHVVFPQLLEENLKNLTEPFIDFSIKPKVYAAHKATQSMALIEKAHELGTGLDVASCAELDHAIIQGFDPKQLVVTGVKNNELLRKAILSRSIISVDSLFELKRIIELSTIENVTPNIMIRLADNAHSEIEIELKLSRFGIISEEITETFQILKDNSIDLIGFHVHHDSSQPAGMIARVQNMLYWTYESYKYGFAPAMIDLGGLFRFPSIDSKNVNHFIEQLEHKLSNGEKIDTYHQSSFGLVRSQTGAIHGREKLTSRLIPTPACTRVNQIMNAEFQGRKIADHIKDLMLEVAIEPGQGLLHMAGVSGAKVIDVKQYKGHSFASIDASSFSLTKMFGDIIADLIIIREGKVLNSETQSEHSVLVGGNSCNEYDIISHKPTFINTQIEAGDILVVPNTASYLMDFATGRPHMCDESNRYQYVFEENDHSLKRDHNFTETIKRTDALA